MRSQLQAGDILFSIAGALGRTAVVTEEILPANTNQALAILRIKKDIKVGEKINRDLIEFQRPCPKDAIKPNDLNKVIVHPTLLFMNPIFFNRYLIWNPKLLNQVKNNIILMINNLIIFLLDLANGRASYCNKDQ